jgi:hypothetical protein
MKKEHFKRIVLLGIITAVIYGPIVAYINWDHGVTVAIKAGLYQGLICFSSAIYSTSMMLLLFQKGKTALTKFLLSFGITSSINLSILISIHLFNGTPNLFWTIIPSILLAAPYYIGFPLTLTYRFKKAELPI